MPFLHQEEYSNMKRDVFQSKNITESFTRGQCYINLLSSFMYVNKLVSFRKISLL